MVKSQHKLPYIISSRVRLARNLPGYRFPTVACSAERQAIVDCIRRAAAKTTWFDKLICLPLDRLDPLERRVLEEKCLISAFLVKQTGQRLAMIAPQASFSILVNEEDHLRLHAIRSGMQLRQAWQTIKKIEQSLRKHLDFAYSEQYGYLTACPSNVGSGRRASVMFFLPGLVLLKRLTPILQKIAASGYTVRGMSGEGSPSQGYLVQISKQGLAAEEEELLQPLENMCERLIAAEQHARREMRMVYRKNLVAYLKEVRQKLTKAVAVDLSEGMHLAAALRLGLALRLAPSGKGALRPRRNRSQAFKKIDNLFIQIQPAHIRQTGLREHQAAYLRNTICHDDPAESEDVLRAQALKRELRVMYAE